MQRYQLRAALAITIDGVAFAEGAVVAEIATAVARVRALGDADRTVARTRRAQVIGFAAGTSIEERANPESARQSPARGAAEGHRHQRRCCGLRWISRPSWQRPAWMTGADPRTLRGL